MTTEAETKVPSTFDELEKHFATDDAFEPTELFSLNEIVSVETIAMPERLLSARNIDAEDAAFKSMFPEGIPCIAVGLRGLDVQYEFDDSGLRNIIVEIVNYQGERAGKPKGQNSHIHLLQEAFLEVFKHGLFGPEHRAALVGSKARWGQHFGKAELGGQRRNWAWDVPRSVLPDDFKWEGDIRTIGKKDAGASGATTVGASELSEEAGLAAILDKTAGRPTEDGEAISGEVLKIQGLPSKYVTAAVAGSLLKGLFDDELINQKSGVIILTEKGEAAKKAAA